MKSKFVKYLFTIILLLATGAQHIYAAISARSEYANNIEYTQTNSSDDIHFELINFTPINHHNHINTSDDRLWEPYVVNEFEDELEAEKHVRINNSVDDSNYFIEQFYAPSHGAFHINVKNIGDSYVYLEESSNPRFILFQVFRL
ncbi:MAG: hypothetical protein ACSHXL_05095 [Bacteroidota bacterium]